MKNSELIKKVAGAIDSVPQYVTLSELEAGRFPRVERAQKVIDTVNASNADLFERLRNLIQKTVENDSLSLESQLRLEKAVDLIDQHTRGFK